LNLYGGHEPISYQTLSSILSQLCVYFKDHELSLEAREEREENLKLPSDRAMLIGAGRSTSQSLKQFPNSPSGEAI
jgi:hypothetical protein